MHIVEESSQKDDAEGDEEFYDEAAAADVVEGWVRDIEVSNGWLSVMCDIRS